FPTASGLGLPPLFTLFKRRWKGWVAILAPGMTGELMVGGETRQIADVLAAPGPKKKKGDWRAVPVGPGDWGGLRLRAPALFFQLPAAEEALPCAPAGPGFVRASSTFSFTLHAVAVACTFLFSTWPPPGASTLGGYVIKISQQTPPPPQPQPEKKPL